MSKPLASRVAPLAMSLALTSAVAPAAALPPLGFTPPVAGPTFGAAVRIDNLAVHPITLASQVDVGPMIPLEEALAKGTAEVRELGAEAAPPRHHGRAEDLPQRRANEQEQVQIGGGGSGPAVNTLVIENRGDVAVFVLAGTVVKGGNQDRQIGQDFVVDAGKVVPVDAFCVERGRWAGAREGRQTAGKFEAATTLATTKVRAAGQHKKDQGEVWSKVAEANAAHGKEAASDTLMATIDAGDLATQSDALAARINAALGTVQADQLVGFAYVVDGKIRGVRWFTSHSLFVMYQDKLVRTAALDALTAAAEAKAARAPAYAGAWPDGAAVGRFVAEAEAAAVKETRDTQAENANEYKESDGAFRAKTMLKAKPGREAAPVSFDYLAK